MIDKRENKLQKPYLTNYNLIHGKFIIKSS